MKEKEEIKGELGDVCLQSETFHKATEAIEFLFFLAEFETGDILFSTANAQLFYLTQAMEDYMFPMLSLEDRLDVNPNYPQASVQSIGGIFTKALDIVFIISALVPKALDDIGTIEISNERFIELAKLYESEGYSLSQGEIDDYRGEFERKVTYLRERIASCPEDETLIGLKKSFVNDLVEFAQEEKRNRKSQQR